MKKILVPIDFSEQAGFALNLALQLAENNKFKITIINVIEMPMGGLIDTSGVTLPPAYHPEFLEQLMKTNKGKMTKFLQKAGLDKKDFEVLFEIGNTYVNLSNELNKNKYELVIMGTKGASGVKEFFIGSNTEKIVRTANCPVIAVHNSTKIKEVKDIAFATTGFDVPDDLMMHVKQLQHMFDANLHIVRINTPNNFERDIIVKRLLENLAKKHMLEKYTINIYNDINEDQGIIDFATSVKAGMIAMGTHGRHGLDHFVFGSLAEDVVNHAKNLIWTYHI